MPVSRRGVLAALGGVVGGGSAAWVARGRLDEEYDPPPCDCADEADHRNYPAQLVRVVDGDTVDLFADLGFRTRKEVRIRIVGIDTAEVHSAPPDSEEYRRGMEQKEFVEEFLATDGDEEWPLVLRSEQETGGYGRWLGDVNADGRWLSEAVLEQWPDATYEESG